MAPDPHAITILRPLDRRRLATKEYIIAPDGRVQRREFGDPKTYAVETTRAANIEALHRLLIDLAPDPAAFIIRGAPLPGADLRQTRRLSKDRAATKDRDGNVTAAAAKATFADVPRQWLMIDADKIAIPDSASVVADPEDVARHLVDLFSGYAPELEGVSCIVQFSSSAGIAEMAEAEAAAGMNNRWGDLAAKGRGTVSAHLWFMLSTPQDGAALKRWALTINAREGGKVIDQQGLVAVQPLYTAAPIFGAGLRDPLAARRVVLVKGSADAAELVIPAEAPRTVHSGGGSAVGAPGFDARLEAIGRDGFHLEINSAIASFISTNWPEPDTARLIEMVQARINAADHGGRSQSQIDGYADADNLQQRIDWIVAAETQKRQQQAEARAEAEARNAVAPTFPDRSVALAEGQRLAGEAVAEFAASLRAGERPDAMLRVSVGGGKSEAAIRGAADLLDAAREGGRDGALYYLVPRHDLGGEIAARIAQAHPGKAVGTWRGMEADDPDAPGKAMCRDPELPKAATAAGLSASVVCPACPLQALCGYQRQRGQKADILIAAHNISFQQKPKGLPNAAVVVVDENFLGAAIQGTDAANPFQMALVALDDDRTGLFRGVERQRLLDLRGRAARILAQHEKGGLLREAFIAGGFTAEGAGEWKALEWAIKPALKFEGSLPREAILAELEKASDSGFLARRAKLAGYVHDLLAGDAARSVNVTLDPYANLRRGQGTAPAVRFEWREDFAQWAAEAPRLFLDATTHPDLLRVWAPDLRVADIEITAPALRMRQVIGRQFGRSFFTATPGNVAKLADLVAVELAEAAGGRVLVIAQQAVEDALRVELARPARFGGAIPDNLELAHHGAITGMDRWRDVARLVVVGRPAMNRTAGERLAEIVAGKPVVVEAAGDLAHWPDVPAGIRRPDGAGTPVAQPRHGDPLVEALRWSITEGAVLQAIGRCRAVQRAEPVHVTLLAQLAMPVTVETVETWDDALPDRLTVAAAEAAVAGRALPLAPADLAAARPDLWGSETAAKRSLSELGAKGSDLLMRGTYKGIGPFRTQTAARYAKIGARRWSVALVPAEGGAEALAAVVGLLARFETAAQAHAPEPPLVQQAAPVAVQTPPHPPEPPPPPPSARIFVMGEDPPFDMPPPRPLPPALPRLVPPAPPPGIRLRMAELFSRLEAVKPPRPHGDGLDLVRHDAWLTRCAAARVGQAAAEAGRMAAMGAA